ncbi:MAG: hypothetical protein ABSH01_12630 [Terriglobia bacterium]
MPAYFAWQFSSQNETPYSPGPYLGTPATTIIAPTSAVAAWSFILLLKIFIGTVKPEALSCAPVNAQPPTDGVAVPAGLQLIVLGEDLDSFQPPASLDRDTQPQGKTAKVDPDVPR